jgi:WD40 repeat protein
VAAAPPAPALRLHLVLATAAEATPCLALAPDGKAVAWGGSGFERKHFRRWGEFRVWDVSTGKLRASWQGHRSVPAALAFSPDGKILVSVTSSLERIYWDSSTGKAKDDFAGTRGNYAIRGLVFSRDGKQLGAWGMSTAVVWDASGKELFSHRWKVHTAPSVLSHDLRLVAVPHYQDVDLWDVRTGKLVRSLLDHRGATGPLAFSRDDRLLAVNCSRLTDDNEQVSEVWLRDAGRAARKRVIALGSFDTRGVALSANGALLAVCGSLDRQAVEVRLFETSQGRELARMRLRGVRWIDNLIFSGNGKMLAATCDREVRLWSVRWSGGTPGGKGTRN